MKKLRHSNYRKLLQEHDDETSSYSSLQTNSTADKQFRQPINSPFDSSMLLTILVLLTALFFIAFFSVYIRRFSNDSTTNIRHRRRRNITPSTSSGFSPSKYVRDSFAVRSLPLISYSGSASHPIDCIICLAEFQEEEKVKMITCCRHVFHPDCIDTWLSSHVSCPLCRSTKIEEVEGIISICEHYSRRRWMADENGTGRNDGLISIRRTRSCSTLSNCVALQRSNSF